MMENISDEICEKIIEVYSNKIPDKVFEEVKMHILDYYSASFAGYRVNHKFNEINRKIYMEMGGLAESTVLFSKKKIPMCNAAYLNAMYAHGADMDDGNSKSAGHIATHVISAVFAMAESKEYIWEDVLRAISVGYDFFNIIGGLAQPYLYQKGFHSTGIVGGIASAAACSYLLGLDKTGMKNAVSLAAVQASGLIIIDESGQSCKPINPANAAKIGVLCARMADEGVEAPFEPLESKKGWFNAFSDLKKLQNSTEWYPYNYTILDSYLKKYPTCRHTHSCIEGACKLREKLRENNWRIGDIKKIKINIYSSAIRSAGSIVCPQNQEEAKFSIAYAVAIALCKKNFSINDILSIDHSNEVEELERKVELYEDETTFVKGKNYRGCRMTIVVKNGDEYNEIVDYPKGEYEKKLSWNEISKKFEECSAGLIDMKDFEDVVSHCIGINRQGKFCVMNKVISER